MALSTRARPSFPHSQALHQEASTSILSSFTRGQTEWKPQSQKTNQNLSHGSQPCLTQWNYEPCHVGLPKRDGSRWRVLKKVWLTGERNGKSLQHSCLQNPMNSIKRQKDKTLKIELPRSVGPQYACGEAWRNSSRRNEEAEPKQKQCPIVDASGGEGKVECCKGQYCTGTWNVRSMNHGKLEVVKQEMARINIDILRISELKWTGMGEYNSDDHYIYYCVK